MIVRDDESTRNERNTGNKPGKLFEVPAGYWGVRGGRLLEGARRPLPPGTAKGAGRNGMLPIKMTRLEKCGWSNKGQSLSSGSDRTAGKGAWEAHPTSWTGNANGNRSFLGRSEPTPNPIRPHLADAMGTYQLRRFLRIE